MQKHRTSAKGLTIGTHNKLLVIELMFKCDFVTVLFTKANPSHYIPFPNSIRHSL